MVIDDCWARCVPGWVLALLEAEVIPGPEQVWGLLLGLETPQTMGLEEAKPVSATAALDPHTGMGWDGAGGAEEP